MVIYFFFTDSVFDYGVDEKGWAQIIRGVVGSVQKWF